MIRRTNHPGEAEIGNLYLSGAREQYVCTLDIPVRQVLLIMQVAEPAKQLLHDALDLRHGKLDLLIRHAGQIKVEVVE